MPRKSTINLLMNDILDENFFKNGLYFSLIRRKLVELGLMSLGWGEKRLFVKFVAKRFVHDDDYSPLSLLNESSGLGLDG